MFHIHSLTGVRRSLYTRLSLTSEHGSWPADPQCRPAREPGSPESGLSAAQRTSHSGPAVLHRPATVPLTRCCRRRPLLPAGRFAIPAVSDGATVPEPPAGHTAGQMRGAQGPPCSLSAARLTGQRQPKATGFKSWAGESTSSGAKQQRAAQACAPRARTSVHTAPRQHAGRGWG